MLLNVVGQFGNEVGVVNKGDFPYFLPNFVDCECKSTSLWYWIITKDTFRQFPLFCLTGDWYIEGLEPTSKVSYALCVMVIVFVLPPEKP